MCNVCCREPFEREVNTYGFQDTEGIKKYYRDLYEENPKVARIKEEILKQKTITEAQRTYLLLKDFLEETPSVYKGKKAILEEIDSREERRLENNEKVLESDFVDKALKSNKGWV